MISFKFPKLLKGYPLISVMATNVVIPPSKVVVSKLKYSEPKALGTKGARSVYVRYDNDKLTIQLPWLSIPYGINDGSKFANDDGGDSAGAKYALDVSFKGSDTNPKIAAALEKFKEIEKKIVDDAFDNRLTWLRDDYDGMKPLVAKLFSPVIKYDKDKDTGKIVGKYPPTMKLKLPFDVKTDSFTFNCEDKNGGELDFKSIMKNLKGGRVLPIIQLGGVWLAGGKYGCSWKLVGARFEAATMTKVQFLPDSDDEAVASEEDEDLAEDVEALKVSEPPKKPAKPAATTVIAESEDEAQEEDAEDDKDSELEEAAEESEEEEDVPPPPPPPPVAAKKKPAAKPAKK